MSNILDFPDQNSPDPEFVFKKVKDNTLVKEFLFECGFKRPDGSDFSFQIWAESHEHAEQIINSLKQTVVVLGQIFSEEEE